MIKKTLKFENLDGEMITEDFWFHLSKAELAELKIVHGDGLEGLMKALNAARDGQAIMDIFKKIISSTVGERSSDGVSFDKEPPYVKRFMNSDAYSVLFMELLEDGKMAEFIIGVLPKDLQEEARKRHLESSKSDDYTKLMTSLREAESQVTTFELNQLLPQIAPEDILLMARVHFDKLDHKKMTTEQLQAAFQRKSSSN